MLRSRNAQRGLALTLLLVVVVLAFTYILISRLPLATRQTAAKREYNAKVLNQAKQALIGWMVMKAAGTDDNPGRLPCAEGVNNIATAQEGIAAPYPGDPGPPPVLGSPNCAAVGRLPWRTLGIDKLVDADAEPLWYAVSPGWALQNTSTTLTINSDKRGQMTVDGQAPPNDVVAVIIAPGRAMNVQAAPGCAARLQARTALAPPPAPAPNPADYIECFNAATPAFSTVGPAASFNDQVLAVTTADVIPELEAAIQQRMQREIAPALKTVYSSAAWGQTGTNPVYPFAAQFAQFDPPSADPGPGPGPGNNYQGSDGLYHGLLPFNCSAAGCASDSRYSPNFVSWTGSGGYPTLTGAALLGGSSCNIVGNVAQCSGTFVGVGTMTFTMKVKATNVAMALRQLKVDPTTITLTYGLGACTTSGTVTGVASTAFQNDGSAVLSIQGQAPGLISASPPFLPLTTNVCMTAQLGMLADHPLLDASTTNPTGWFVRNEWYRLVWYVVAPRNTVDNLSAGATPLDCLPGPYTPPPPATAAQCLKFNGTQNFRAVLVLAGGSLTNPANRPNNDSTDYLEHANCNRKLVSGVFKCVPGPTFEQRAMRTDKYLRSPAITGDPFYAPFNDRLVLVDWTPPSPAFTPTLPISPLLP